MTAEEIGKLLDAEMERRAMGEKLGEDAQRGKLIAVVQSLLPRLAKPIDALRILQAARVDVGLPGAKDRAGIRLVNEVLRPSLPALVGRDPVGWASLVAGVVRENPAGAWLFKTGVANISSQFEFPAVKISALPKKEELISRDVSTLLESRKNLKIESQSSHYNDTTWNSDQVNAVFDKCMLPAIRSVAVRTESGLVWTESAVQLLHKTVSDLAKSQNTFSLDLRKALDSRESNALWWTQSLYSRTASADYRDILEDTPSLLLGHMATDLIAVMGSTPDPSVAALFVETALRLMPDLNTKKSWADWQKSLLSPTAYSEEFKQLVRDDDTLISIAGTMVHDRSPDEEISGRKFARLYFRERQLATWLAGG